MAEFKVNKSLAGEISAFEKTGIGICSSTTEIDSSGVSTLKTATAYVTQHNAIVALIKLYQSLVARDASDVVAMMKSAEELDTIIAKRTKATEGGR